MAHPVLDRVRIASPCPADWSAMRGDERTRHCEACGLRVHNLAAMTTPEIQRLIARPGRTCARLHRRADGTVITGDCPVGRRVVRRQRAVMAAALLAFWTASEHAAARVWTVVGGRPDVVGVLGERVRAWAQPILDGIPEEPFATEVAGDVAAFDPLTDEEIAPVGGF